MFNTTIASVKPSAVRKSIKKLFPLGSVFSKGSNNPITIHASDDNAFARVWSLIAETMVAKSKLSRNLKEKVATLVSKKNQCPVCILAHNMMVKASEEKQSDDDRSLQTEGTATPEDFERIVLEYTEALVQSTWTQDTSFYDIKDEDDNDFCMLDDDTKAEIALIVMLFSHMNRAVSAIMGTEMSTAIFKVPRPVARAVETASFMSTINRLMAPMLSGPLVAKVEAGCTDHLFSTTKKRRGHSAVLEANPILPAHLEGVRLAGEARAQAVGRLAEWSEVYYETELKAKCLLPNHALTFLDEDPAARPPKGASLLSHKIVAWIGSDLRVIVQALDVGDLNRTIVLVLLYVSYAPKAIQHSSQWQELVCLMGEKRARALVIWWSVRFTLKKAKGFD